MEVSEIISSLGGAVFGAFSTFFFQKKRENRDDFSILVGEYKNLLAQLKESIIETQARETKCEENVMQLEQKISELRREIAK